MLKSYLLDKSITFKHDLSHIRLGQSEIGRNVSLDADILCSWINSTNCDFYKSWTCFTICWFPLPGWNLHHGSCSPPTPSYPHLADCSVGIFYQANNAVFGFDGMYLGWHPAHYFNRPYFFADIILEYFSIMATQVNHCSTSRLFMIPNAHSTLPILPSLTAFTDFRNFGV